MKRLPLHLLLAAFIVFAFAGCDEDTSTTDGANDAAAEITEGVDLEDGEFTEGGNDTDTDTGSDAAPSFVQPDDAAIDYGDRISMEMSGGDDGTSFQWFVGKSGDTSKPVSSSPKYVTPPLTDTTELWVRASNSAGTKDSDTITITVKPPEALVP